MGLHARTRGELRDPSPERVGAHPHGRDRAVQRRRRHLDVRDGAAAGRGRDRGPGRHLPARAGRCPGRLLLEGRLARPDRGGRCSPQRRLDAVRAGAGVHAAACAPRQRACRPGHRAPAHWPTRRCAAATPSSSRRSSNGPSASPSGSASTCRSWRTRRPRSWCCAWRTRRSTTATRRSSRCWGSSAVRWRARAPSSCSSIRRTCDRSWPRCASTGTRRARSAYAPRAGASSTG